MKIKLPIIYEDNLVIRPINLKDTMAIFNSYRQREEVGHLNFGPFETFLECRNWLNNYLKVSSLYAIFVEGEYIGHIEHEVINDNELRFSVATNSIKSKSKELTNALNLIIPVYLSNNDFEKTTISVPVIDKGINQILTKLDYNVDKVLEKAFFHRFSGEEIDLNLYEISRSV